jgi:hypothetical protein
MDWRIKLAFSCYTRCTILAIAKSNHIITSCLVVPNASVDPNVSVYNQRRKNGYIPLSDRCVCIAII